jgi:hypothetical protein
MKKLIHSCDFLGFSPSLHINSKKLYQSTFTAILSILVAFVSLLCVGYFGSDLFLKSTPTVVVTREDLEDFGPYNLSSTEFNMMVSIQYNNNTAYVDPTVYSWSASNMKIVYETNNLTGESVTKF